MKKIRWGVMSTAKIAINKVIPALQSSRLNTVVAIASRVQSVATIAAEKLGIECAYAHYDLLIEDPNIDAIYIPLPNHLHIPWAIKAINAGKHVLCEKPAGMHSAEIEKLIAHSAQHPHIKVMEALVYPFHPQWQAIHAIIQAEKIGKVRSIHSHFSHNNHETNNIRNNLTMGGGVLMDIGCYCISLSRFIFNDEPQCVIGHTSTYENYEVDCFASAIMKFPQGTATFTVSSKTEPRQFVEINGELGSIYIPRPFGPALNEESHFIIKQHNQNEKMTQCSSNQYSNMCDAFSLSILQNSTPPISLQNSLANMKVIDAIFVSTKKNQWVDIA